MVNNLANDIVGYFIVVVRIATAAQDRMAGRKRLFGINTYLESVYFLFSVVFLGTE